MILVFPPLVSKVSTMPPTANMAEHVVCHFYTFLPILVGPIKCSKMSPTMEKLTKLLNHTVPPLIMRSKYKRLPQLQTK